MCLQPTQGGIQGPAPLPKQPSPPPLDKLLLQKALCQPALLETSLLSHLGVPRGSGQSGQQLCLPMTCKQIFLILNNPLACLLAQELSRYIWPHRGGEGCAGGERVSQRQTGANSKIQQSSELQQIHTPQAWGSKASRRAGNTGPVRGRLETRYKQVSRKKSGPSTRPRARHPGFWSCHCLHHPLVGWGHLVSTYCIPGYVLGPIIPGILLYPLFFCCKW